jgi:hypothetical protein
MGPAARAVERDLRDLPDDLREGLLAATLLELARQLDSPDNSLTSKSAAAAQVLALWNRLRELAPAEEEADAVTDIQRRAALTLAGVPGAAS